MGVSPQYIVPGGEGTGNEHAVDSTGAGVYRPGLMKKNVFTEEIIVKW
jgi:hypothetical protein